mmetsp:Transcript_8314/g.13453  ORF Transcript_8314/g.13453 Transcript_8314/m.13453 type:complete len:117 (-) Transcript_8314:437-787(-)
MKRNSDSVGTSGSSSEWSEQFCDFIRCCLIKNFKMRPKARNLLQHEFLKTRNWNRMNGGSTGSRIAPFQIPNDDNIDEGNDRNASQVTTGSDKYAYIRELQPSLESAEVHNNFLIK